MSYATMHIATTCMWLTIVLAVYLLSCPLLFPKMACSNPTNIASHACSIWHRFQLLTLKYDRMCVQDRIMEESFLQVSCSYYLKAHQSCYNISIFMSTYITLFLYALALQTLQFWKLAVKDCTLPISFDLYHWYSSAKNRNESLKMGNLFVNVGRLEPKIWSHPIIVPKHVMKWKLLVLKSFIYTI